MTDEELDQYILPSTIKRIPPRSDHYAWLQISHVTLTNVRGLIRTGYSERALEIIKHYKQRWEKVKS